MIITRISCDARDWEIKNLMELEPVESSASIISTCCAWRPRKFLAMKNHRQMEWNRKHDKLNNQLNKRKILKTFPGTSHSTLIWVWRERNKQNWLGTSGELMGSEFLPRKFSNLRCVYEEIVSCGNLWKVGRWNKKTKIGISIVKGFSWTSSAAREWNFHGHTNIDFCVFIFASKLDNV